MHIESASVVVSGGASGLGWATASQLAGRGARVVIADLPSSRGAEAAQELAGAQFVPADVTEPEQLDAAFAAAEGTGPLRAVVHTAGRGGPQRVVDRDGNPGSLQKFEDVLRLNVSGTYNAVRLAAARMARQDPVDGERGVLVLTSSAAAYEGQIGQIAYASSKAAIVGMTLCAARDLASKQIRVCTIAPGIFDTPLLAGAPEEVRAGLNAAVPHPRRMGVPEEYAKLALQIVENPYLNGETIRLDGAIRMQPK